MIHYTAPETWSEADRATVECAAHIIGVRLTRFLNADPVVSFERVFGTQSVYLSYSLAYWAYSTENRIGFRPGKVLLPLAIHELGHTFDRRYQLRPSRDLWDANIDRPAYIFPANGHLWPGMHPPSLGDYDPQETWANLFADYMLDMLAQNSTGAKLAGWMDEKMDEWLGRDECRVTTGTA